MPFTRKLLQRLIIHLVKRHRDDPQLTRRACGKCLRVVWLSMNRVNDRIGQTSFGYQLGGFVINRVHVVAATCTHLHLDPEHRLHGALNRFGIRIHYPRTWMNFHHRRTACRRCSDRRILHHGIGQQLLGKPPGLTLVDRPLDQIDRGGVNTRRRI